MSKTSCQLSTCILISLFIQFWLTSKPIRSHLISRRFHICFTSNLLSIHFDCTWSSLRFHFDLISIAIWFPVRFTSVSHRSHINFTSAWLSISHRLHFDYTSSSLRFHFNILSNKLRVHFRFTSKSLRFHFDFTLVWLRLHSRFTLDSLRFHLGTLHKTGRQ